MSLVCSETQIVPVKVEIQQNRWQKYFTWIRQTTIEPTMFLYMLAYMITSVVEQAFFVHKSCRVDHSLSEELCNDLDANTTLQAQVQVTVSSFHQWNNIVSFVFPIILSPFFGGWSDRRGRKAPLIIALTGKAIYAGMLTVNSLMTTWNLNMVIWTASLPMGMLGSDIVIFASAFSYISDVSSVKQRTLRMAILDIVQLSVMPAGIALGSYLYYDVVNSSYTIMFTIQCGLLILSVVYSALRLEMRTTAQQMPVEKGTNLFFDFFDKKHLVENLRTVTRSRPGHRRLYLWILIVAMALDAFQKDEPPMSYLYTQLTFSWDVSSFSNFRIVQSTLFAVAMVLGIPLMSNVLGMRDTMIVAVGALSHAAGRVLFATANTVQLFYAGAVVAALGPVGHTVLRSITSKVVPTSERGKVFALLSVCDNAVPLFSGIMYSQLYNATVTTTPSSIYWLTFSTQIGVLLLIMSIHVSLGSRPLDSGIEENGDICKPGFGKEQSSHSEVGENNPVAA